MPTQGGVLQPQYESYSCELCGNDAHYGYDCPPRVPLVFEQEPGPHESFQCQLMNQNYFEPNSNYYGFDRPSQYPIDQSPPQEMSIQDMEDLKQQYLDEMQSINDDDEEESTIPLNEIISQIPPSIAITPVLSNSDPRGVSLIMGDEDLRTIPEKESDEVIKSSVDDLVPIPSESEDTSSNDEIDLPFCDDSSPLDVLGGNFVTFSNHLFDSNDDFTSSDDESL
ncbi:hypothetical protein Tco_1485224 [Tanacetum coccineum]